MYTYPYIEDYIEIIAGHKAPNGKPSLGVFQLPESLISLARYDVKVVESFAEQIANNIGFTDRQSSLARDLVYKYERQLHKHGVDISSVKEQVQYRFPIRVLDRSQRVWLDGNLIKLRFPYNDATIEQVREESKVSEGNIHWEPAQKVWSAELTEYNLNWAHTFAKTNKFEIDTELQTLMDQLLTTEQQPYAIELQARDQLSIINAPNTLTEYVENNLGGFDLDNLIRLVDHAPLLGYSIETDIEAAVIQAYSTRFYSLCANKEVKVDLNMPMQDQVAEIVQYATINNRFPIYIYEPDMSDRLIMLFIRHFTKEQIVDLDKTPTAITKATRLVYARKIPRAPAPTIPLMISAAGMLFGGDRQLWVQSAEKIVYFTKDVYTKKNVGRHLKHI
jgi:hypothetical protein